MDGQRDYWSPYGNGDMLDRAWQLAFVNGYGSDEHVEHALGVATWGGASVIDRTLRRSTSATRIRVSRSATRPNSSWSTR